MAFLRGRVIALAVASMGVAVVALDCTEGPWKPALPDRDASSDASFGCDELATCDAGCVDLATSLTNCGACGRACDVGQTCSAGACKGCESIDSDGDGESSCTDCDDKNPLVGHSAFDVLGNGIDDDCNEKVDDAPACEGAPASTSADPNDYAHAIELCSPSLMKAELTSPDDRARQIAVDWGTFAPRAGGRFSAFSTGVAAATNHTAPAPIFGQTPQLGTAFGKTGTPYPVVPTSQQCPQTLLDPTTVVDATAFTVTLLVPTNARSFAVDLNFLTADAPEWPCNGYDDQALVVLDSAALKGNLLIDGKGRRMSVNHELVLLKSPSELTGTGFDVIDGNGNPKGAGTGWLTLRAPVTPREVITLRFHLFDAQDGLYDSQLLIDHFRWSNETVACASTGLVDAGAPPCVSPALDAGKD